jgi:hypothetical protein
MIWRLEPAFCALYQRLAVFVVAVLQWGLYPVCVGLYYSTTQLIFAAATTLRVENPLTNTVTVASSAV